ncbi:fimbrial protein [Scandinavium sp. NPDC088450]|uniref:fimbrial protein n=1 Tax=Scandinavium sp. NPDC088450 TaxID=3364514 RepID=UPI00384F7E55
MNEATSYVMGGNKKRVRIAAIIRLGLMVILSGNAMSAMADTTCKNSAIYPAQTLVPSMNVPAVYTGNDLPVGSTLYRAKMTLSTNVGVSCDAAYTLSSILSVSQEMAGTPVTMSTVYGSGPVYPTNVPGIGVAVWAASPAGGNVLFSKSSPADYVKFQRDSAGDVGQKQAINVSLIKTGAIASGSVVNATSFPHIVWSIPAASGYSGLPLTLLEYSFTGTLSYITQTCTTPDVNVKLGQYEIAKYFTGQGSSTPWIDASIVMTNCPTFSGYHADGATIQTVLNAEAARGTTLKANFLSVSLSPVNPVTNNIIGLDASDNSATGVGIQLGYSTDVDANTAVPEKLWTNGSSWDVNLPADGRSTVKIPLSARYYQNAEKVTPGKASAKVVFQIDYK